MRLHQVSASCFAVCNEKNRACDANSGLVNRGGSVVVDTQADLRHARRMLELFGTVGPGMPRHVINTSADGDHVAGNQLFPHAEIIAHRAVPDCMRQLAERPPYRMLCGTSACGGAGSGSPSVRPGVLAMVRQLREDYDFAGIEATLPATLFDDRYVLDLDGMEVHVIHVGPCRQAGDAIVHVPAEGVLFAGDTVFRNCTCMGWTGDHQRWLQCLDLIVWLDPEVIVPGHGPLCGIEGAMEMKAYLEYVQDESRQCFALGLTVLEAAMRIELGPYAAWRCPARLVANVECAYRDLRGEAAEGASAPWDAASTFDAMYQMAIARGLPIEF